MTGNILAVGNFIYSVSFTACAHPFTYEGDKVIAHVKAHHVKAWSGTVSGVYLYGLQPEYLLGETAFFPEIYDAVELHEVAGAPEHAVLVDELLVGDDEPHAPQIEEAVHEADGDCQ